VYLDAAFFPLLQELDFRQEGHRLEFENFEGNDAILSWAISYHPVPPPNYTDPASPLKYKGVVFNEMKGAMVAISSHNSFLVLILPPTTVRQQFSISARNVYGTISDLNIHSQLWRRSQEHS